MEQSTASEQPVCRIEIGPEFLLEQGTLDRSLTLRMKIVKKTLIETLFALWAHPEFQLF